MNTNVRKETTLNKRQLQAIQTKNAIYESALKVINRDGFDNTTIEAITTDAGVSVGSFYTYFPSKENLLEYSYVQLEDLYYDALRECENIPFPQSLYNLIRIAYDGIEQRGKKVLHAIVRTMQNPDFNADVLDYNRAFFKTIMVLIDKAKADGKLSESVDTHECVTELFMVLTGVEMYWCISKHQRSLSEIAEKIVKTMVVGINEQKKDDEK